MDGKKKHKKKEEKAKFPKFGLRILNNTNEVKSGLQLDAVAWWAYQKCLLYWWADGHGKSESDVMSWWHYGTMAYVKISLDHFLEILPRKWGAQWRTVVVASSSLSPTPLLGPSPEFLSSSSHPLSHPLIIFLLDCYISAGGFRAGGQLNRAAYLEMILYTSVFFLYEAPASTAFKGRFPFLPSPLEQSLTVSLSRQQVRNILVQQLRKLNCMMRPQVMKFNGGIELTKSLY